MNIQYRIKALLLAAVLVFTATSCDKFIRDDININPTQSADIDPAFQFTFCQVFLSQNRYEHWRTNFILTSCMIQHTAQTAGYFEGDKYTYGIPSYNAALWESAYTREIQNVVDLISRIDVDAKSTNNNILQAARILRVYMFSRMTDLYGDVPYSEAAQGFLDRDFLPAYDTQESIYTDFLKELSEATAALESGVEVRGDVLLGGDADKWKKWGNSLRLRLGMRLSKVDAAKAATEVGAAITGGVMESNDDMAMLVHTQQRSNGNSDVFWADQGMRLSETFVKYMKDNNDPRLPIYGAIYMNDTLLMPQYFPIPDGASASVSVLGGKDFNKIVGPNGENVLAYALSTGDYSGIDGLPNGTNFADLEESEKDRFVAPNYENIGPQEVPYIHQTYAEVEFLLAEAAMRGWGASGAKDHFAAGLRAMVEMMDKYPGNSASLVAGADIDAFVNDHLTKWDAANADGQMEMIGTALWSALYLDGYEAFAHWRRTGYPAFTPVNHPNGITNGTVPRRCHYPGSEAGLNAENYKAAVGRMSNGDSYLSRVWWDK